MKRILIGIATTLFLGWFVVVSTLPACACSPLRSVSLRALVRPGPGWSVGLVTVTAGGGEIRTNPSTGRSETAIRVAPASWVGTLPTTLWVPNDAVPPPTKRLMRTPSPPLTPRWRHSDQGRNGS